MEIVYVVHSDTDENNTLREFDSKQEAINYAKMCDSAWVDRIEYNSDTDEVEDEETVWAYYFDDEEED